MAKIDAPVESSTNTLPKNIAARTNASVMRRSATMNTAQNQSALATADNPRYAVTSGQATRRMSDTLNAVATIAAPNNACRRSQTTPSAAKATTSQRR